MKQRDLLEEIAQEKQRLATVSDRNEKQNEDLALEIYGMLTSYFTKGITYGELEHKINEYKIRTRRK